MSAHTGRNQAAILKKLASAPGGLTAVELACLVPGPDPAAQQSRAAITLRTLGKRGFTTHIGARRANPASLKPKTSRVWAITQAGRDEDARVAAVQSRTGRAERRIIRRSAVAAAIAEETGPGTPAATRLARARVLREAGCTHREIALVFAVTEASAAKLLRSES
jgi:hypothetical protein